MHIFVLTGAGISAESGLGTFRDAGGLWAKYDPMTLATPDAFARDPETVHAFYNARRRAALAAQPNPAHAALARLASASHLVLVTQNVDDLHERAGSDGVIHMHGELLRVRCTACAAGFAWPGDVTTATPCPACARIGTLRPDVVWFGEVPRHMERIEQALAAADLFVAIGTSGAVYPAAGFVAASRRHGVATCELNLAPSDNAGLFDTAQYGPASTVVPAWVERVSATPLRS